MEGGVEDAGAQAGECFGCHWGGGWERGELGERSMGCLVGELGMTSGYGLRGGALTDGRSAGLRVPWIPSLAVDDI